MPKLSKHNNDMRQTAMNKAQITYDRAKNTADSTYKQVQSQWMKLAQLVLAGGAALFSYNRQKALRDQKRLRKQAQNWQEDFQDTVSPVWSKTQDTVQSGMDTLSKQSAIAQKNLAKASKKAQKNLRQMQKVARKRFQSGMATTQDLWQQGTEKAATSARDFRDSVQEQYKRRQRKRSRARALFRWGLVIGVVAALLYAPLSGSETRQRLMAQWQELRATFTPQ
jgi:gas vesicle protein